MHMIRNRQFALLGIVLMLAGLVAACSSDSPTNPKQEPTTPPGTGSPSATWNISVSANPDTLQGSVTSSLITVRVTNASTGAAPTRGTSVVVSTSLGSFDQFDSTLTSVAVGLSGSTGAVTLFAPSSTTGTAVVQARLEQSSGSTSVRIIEAEGPFISHVEPSVGRPEGGYTVRIMGGGFFPEITATIGGLPAEVLSSSSDSATVRVPGISLSANSTSTVAVGLTVGQGTSTSRSLSLASAFTYAHGGSTFAPEVFSISPTQGENEGGYQAVIRGANFDSPSQVLFGNSQPFVEASVVSIRSNEIVVIVPAATGFGQVNQNSTVAITIRSLNTGQEGTLTGGFTYGTGSPNDMFISSMSPTQGSIDGGTLVTIFGFGFEEPVTASFTGGNSNTDQQSIAQQVISVAGTQIVVRTAPPQRSGCGDISYTGVAVVNVETGQAANASVGFTYNSPEPVLLSVSPASGGEAGGNTVTLSGVNFESPAVVKFGDNSALITTVVSSTTTTAVVPPFTGDFNEDECDDNADGTLGSRWVSTSVDVEWSNPLFDNCSTVLDNGYTYNPADTSCRNDDAPINTTPPTADFTWNPAAPVAGAPVNFVDLSTGGLGSSLVAWRWDFGDGTAPVTTQNPSHTFAPAGDYVVVLQVTNGRGDIASTTQTVTIN